MLTPQAELLAQIAAGNVVFALDPTTLCELQSLEEELWREETRFDTRRLEQLLAPDFTEVGRSGRRWSRDQIVAMPRTRIDARLPLPNFAARLLTPGVALLSYDSEVTYGSVVERARRTSLWTHDGMRWQLRHHQGTPCEP